jgi:hypothetical protein
VTVLLFVRLPAAWGKIGGVPPFSYQGAPDLFQAAPPRAKIPN